MTAGFTSYFAAPQTTSNRLINVCCAAFDCISRLHNSNHDVVLEEESLLLKKMRSAVFDITLSSQQIDATSQLDCASISFTERRGLNSLLALLITCSGMLLVDDLFMLTH